MASPDQLDLISPADDVWSVTRLTTTVKQMVEGEIPAIWVRGEVTGRSPALDQNEAARVIRVTQPTSASLATTQLEPVQSNR